MARNSIAASSALSRSKCRCLRGEALLFHFFLAAPLVNNFPECTASKFNELNNRRGLPVPIAPTKYVDIEYEDRGAQTANPLSCSTVFRQPAYLGQKSSPSLKHQPLRFLVPHLRGFGGTHVKNCEAMSCQTAALAQDVLDFADALNVQKFLLVGHDWGARAAYSAAVLAPQRLTYLLALPTPYLMFQGKRESPEQVRAYWYQWYFNTQRGQQAFEADPVPFYEYIWRTWSPEWNYTPGEIASAQPAWNNPQLVPFVISYYRHRYGNAPGASASRNSNRSSIDSPCHPSKSPRFSPAASLMQQIFPPLPKGRTRGSLAAMNASSSPG